MPMLAVTHTHTHTHIHTPEKIKDIQIGTFLTSFPPASCDVCTKGVKLRSSETRLPMMGTHTFQTNWTISNFQGSSWIAVTVLAPELLKLTANSLTLSKPPNSLLPSLPTLSPLSYCKELCKALDSRRRLLQGSEKPAL